MITRPLLLSSALALFLTACSTAQVTPPADEHAMHSMAPTSAALESGIESRLNESPRHQEWVDIQNGDKTIRTWVVYPQTDGQTPVVLLIHENRGLSDWVRAMADQVAEAGYIAVAPDLLSGYGEDRMSTAEFPNDDARTQAIGQLETADVQSDLLAVAAWTKTIPASNGKLASAGFCWGGGQSFQLATESKDLSMALVFYGTGPADANAYPAINAPVIGFYGGEDGRVNATIDATRTQMASTGKTYDYEIYEGAGHAFMRLGEDPAGSPANIAARAAAWERMKATLANM